MTHLGLSIALPASWLAYDVDMPLPADVMASIRERDPDTASTVEGTVHRPRPDAGALDPNGLFAVDPVSLGKVQVWVVTAPDEGETVVDHLRDFAESMVDEPSVSYDAASEARSVESDVGEAASVELSEAGRTTAIRYAVAIDNVRLLNLSFGAAEDATSARALAADIAATLTRVDGSKKGDTGPPANDPVLESRVPSEVDGINLRISSFSGRGIQASGVAAVTATPFTDLIDRFDHPDDVAYASAAGVGDELLLITAIRVDGLGPVDWDSYVSQKFGSSAKGITVDGRSAVLLAGADATVVNAVYWSGNTLYQVTARDRDVIDAAIRALPV